MYVCLKTCHLQPEPTVTLVIKLHGRKIYVHHLMVNMQSKFKKKLYSRASLNFLDVI